MYSLYLFLIYSASTRSLLFLSFIVSIFLGKMFPWYLLFSWRDLLSFPFCCFLLVLCTVHWRRPSCCSMLFFGNLHLVGYTVPFLPCFLLLFFLSLFVRPPQITTLPSCFSCFFGWFCSLPPVQYYRPPFIVLQAHCLQVLIPWIYPLPPLHIHRGFDLSCTWLA